MWELLSAGLFSLGKPAIAATGLTTATATSWTDVATGIAQVGHTVPAQVAQLPDPRLEQLVQTYLQRLADRGLSASQQGVWVQVGTTPIAAHLGQVALPAASLTKVATTLAALSTWGPDHRFPTLVGYTGRLNQGVLNGDLVVYSTGDPLFVWEEAIALGNTLQAAGIQTVRGRLLVTPAFTMNFNPDPQAAANLLRQSLDASQWSTTITAQHATLPPNTPRPRLVITGGTGVIPGNSAVVQQATPIVQHDSLALAVILKSMNVYSNNEMSEQVARLLGGADRVAATAAQMTDMPQQTIRLINGSGLGEENRLAAQTVVEMLIEIQGLLAEPELTIADLFPVSGRDQGTLIYRAIPTAAAVKTGTLNTVSALAGALPTRDRGVVWFALINRGTDIEGLRAEQDRFLQDVQQFWGAAQPIPADIQPKLNANGDRLGNSQRNQILAPAQPTSLRHYLSDDPTAADHDRLVF